MNRLLRATAPGAVLLLSLSGGTRAADDVADAAAAEANTTCRHVVSGSEAGKTYCGTAEQWAEFDRRVALVNADIACRELLGVADGSCLDGEDEDGQARRANHERRVNGLMSSNDDRGTYAAREYGAQQAQQAADFQNVQQMVDQAQFAPPTP